MPSMRIRWSEQEARKPYARPFMVTFTGDDDTDVGSVALNGADLLYYTQFQAAVLSLAGELFVEPAVESSSDPQRAWLDRIAGLMPAVTLLGITPRSTFDDTQGRVFRMVIKADGGQAAIVDASGLLEYQELQAVLAHQTGGLYRDLGVEAVEDPGDRRRAWIGALRLLMSRPDHDEAMNEAWHWA
jgi:hypothetical protein